MSDRLADDGLTSIVSGSIDGSNATDAALTSTDGAATMTRTDTGDFTVTFGAAFNSAPIVTASITGAVVATEAQTVQIITTAATDVTFTTLNTSGTTVAVAAADLDFAFMAIGSRNR